MKFGIRNDQDYSRHSQNIDLSIDDLRNANGWIKRQPISTLPAEEIQSIYKLIKALSAALQDNADLENAMRELEEQERLLFGDTEIFQSDEFDKTLLEIFNVRRDMEGFAND